MRSRLVYGAILALTIALVVPSTAAAAVNPGTVDVAAARVAAENQLISLGIDPGTAVFQIGAQNYAGANCPGSDWNCTSAATVVQIATGTVATSANKFDRCTTVSCKIIQDSTLTGGNNEARCVQRPSDNTQISDDSQTWDDSQTSTNPASQSCTISQITTAGRNRAFVLQLVVQAQAEDPQHATQNAAVYQSNLTGANQSTVAQTIRQEESKHIALSTGATQKQEAHQTAFVCQGGGSNPCSSKSNGTNKSSLAQTNIQRAGVQFDEGANGTIFQNQNTDPSGPKSRAVVRQNSVDQSNGATLLQFNRQIATVHTADSGEDDDSSNATSGFAGFVTQTQGDGSLCPGGGVCGWEFQNSTGVQRAVERQDEVLRLVAPPLAIQNQSGPEFCCATQTGGNSANVNKVTQSKALFHTSSSTQGDIHGHCVSDGECTVDETISDNGTTTTNNCIESPCNITVHCSTTTGGEPPVTTTTCTKPAAPTPPAPPVIPPPPCPTDSCSTGLLWRDGGPATTGAEALVWRDGEPATTGAEALVWRDGGPATG